MPPKSSPRRWLVVGSSGAGKTTLARRMAEGLGLPLVHLDLEYWRPGWREPPRDEWEQRVRSLCAGEAWIIDGNYGGSFQIRLERAEAVVLLDVPAWRCVLAVLRRRAASVFRSRADLPPGVRDRITFDFLSWIWRFRRRDLPRLEAKLVGAAVPVYRLGSRKAARDFLEGLVG